MLIFSGVLFKQIFDPDFQIGIIINFFPDEIACQNTNNDKHGPPEAITDEQNAGQQAQ
jgi:hypothetical protein